MGGNGQDFPKNLAEVRKLPAAKQRALLFQAYRTLEDADIMHEANSASREQVIQKYGSADEALNRHIYALRYLLTCIEGEQFGPPIKEIPTDGMMILNLLTRKWGHINPHEEANIAEEVEKRIRNLESRYGNQITILRDKLKALRQEVDKYENKSDRAEATLRKLVKDYQDVQSDLRASKKANHELLQENETRTRMHNEKVKLVEELEKKVEDWEEYSGKQDKTIHGLEEAVETLEEDKGVLSSELRDARDKIKLGWLSAAAVAVLAGALYFFAPRYSETAPKQVPVETIKYSAGKVTVKFGDESFKMDLEKLSEIYSKLDADAEKHGKKMTPAERKEYFDKKAEKYIK